MTLIDLKIKYECTYTYEYIKNYILKYYLQNKMKLVRTYDKISRVKIGNRMI